MKRWVVFCWALLLMSGAVALTACGQKGPLYLPDPPARQQGK